MSPYYLMLFLITTLYFSLEIRFKIFTYIILGITIIEGTYKLINEVKKIPLFLIYCFFGYLILLTNNPITHYIALFFPIQKVLRCLLFYSIFSQYSESELTKKNHPFTYYKSYYYDRPYEFYFLIFELILIKIFEYYFLNFYFIDYYPKDKFIKPEDKFFICVLLHNPSKYDFHHFFLEITDLIKYIGPEKVYLSIFDNNSTELVKKTKVIINDLNEWLIVNNVDYIFDRTELFNRSNYKNKEHFFIDWTNHALEFLYKKKDIDYNNTKIIFIDDEVYYFYQDIIKLIGTNKGDYDIVCPLTLERGLFDRKVWYGIDGTLFNKIYPFAKDRNAIDIILNEEILRVFSCGKGIIITKALPFKDKKIKFRPSGNKDLEESKYLMLSKDFYLNGYQKVLINTYVKVYRNDYWQNIYIYKYPIEIESFFYLGQFFISFKYGFNPFYGDLKKDKYDLNEKLKDLFNKIQ